MAIIIFKSIVWKGCGISILHAFHSPNNHTLDVLKNKTVVVIRGDILGRLVNLDIRKLANTVV